MKNISTFANSSEHGKIDEEHLLQNDKCFVMMNLIMKYGYFILYLIQIFQFLSYPGAYLLIIQLSHKSLNHIKKTMMPLTYQQKYDR